MSEKQNVEWKLNWRDEWLEWICGFANAQGGKLIIGKNNRGVVVGVEDHEELLKTIPDKITNLLGVVCDVDLKKSGKKNMIQISVESQSVPISYHGKYYYRSGGTNRQLQGSQLTSFLLKKSGKTWDAVVEPNSSLKDISKEALRAFRKAASTTGRLPNLPKEDDRALLEKLRVMKNGKLTRAALIAFGNDPRKFFPGAFVKIGRFGQSDDDLVFQDEIEGDAFRLADQVVELLAKKFLPGKITFEGLYRKEGSGYPFQALREVILNAIVHRQYSATPVQISIYDDRLIFWNEGALPEELSLADLKKAHPSVPRNPLLADVFSKGGLIEAWGTGTLKVIEYCKIGGLPAPLYDSTTGGIQVTLRKKPEALSELNQRQLKALDFLRRHRTISNQQYQKLNGCSRNTASADLQALVKKGLVRSSGQRGAGAYYVSKNEPMPIKKVIRKRD